MSKLENKLTRFQSNPFYFVTCEELSLGRRDEEVVEKVLRGGIKLIQLRDKLATPKKIFKKAKCLRKLTNSYDALLIINDNLDVALSVGADGVHLGQDDLPLSVAQNLVATHARQDDFFKDFLIGQSTHNLTEVKETVEFIKKIAYKTAEFEQGAGYYNIGPIYETKTKVHNYPPLGLDGLQEIIQAVKEENIPFSVMGGIKLGHLSEFFKQSIHPISMVTEICRQPNIEEFVRSLMSEYQDHLKREELTREELTINN